MLITSIMPTSVRDVNDVSRRDHDGHLFGSLWYTNHYTIRNRGRIDFHHDHHTTMMGVVAGVSLGSACELRLRVPDPGFRRAPFHVHLPRRSLYLMTGLSRWHLQHGIPSLMGDRVSLTFRTVDPGCARSIPEQIIATICKSNHRAFSRVVCGLVLDHCGSREFLGGLFRERSGIRSGVFQATVRSEVVQVESDGLQITKLVFCISRHEELFCD